MSADTAYAWARILTCGIWLAAGLYKATHFQHTTAEMRQHGIPFASAILPFVIVLEVAGSVLLFVDRWVWAVCLAWLAFMIPASYIYHARFMVRAGTIDFGQYITFWKNVSIAGGLIALILLDSSRPSWLLGP
ncbi:MAG TPA: DoxX family protein [Gammaproteobacteria bacterium]